MMFEHDLIRDFIDGWTQCEGSRFCNDGAGTWLRTEDGSLKIHFDVPGVTKDDLAVTPDGDRLLVDGRRKLLGARTYSWALSVPLSHSPERAEASLRDGVLVLTVPKKAETAKKKIEIFS